MNKSNTPNTLFEELDTLRGGDQYPSEEIKNKLINLHFPASTEDLAINLSNITSQFYALLLQSIGARYGIDEIRVQSDTLFYNLGKAKAQKALQKDPAMERDCRSFITVLISAILTSNPELKFAVEQFSPNQAIIRLTGIDRYHRAAKQYEIDSYLNFPSIVPFFQGIKDCLELKGATIKVSESSYDANSNMDCTYTFIQHSQTSASLSIEE
ncbi:hypothetical protein CYY_008149 [Polysphondylium violaceum]|uniref:Uncharacterized protein n=1 Tax=Polysphondylium violaceum TaxID=133409 RepID=A0A8J4UQD6_9MYCE|nr:hypothetical protein CYY_008149 [Polysphondylium violaceum]